MKLHLVTAVVLGLPFATVAQSQPTAQADVSGMPMMVIEMKPGDTQLIRSQPPSEGKLSRWLDFDALSISTRYRHVESLLGTTTASNVQHQIAVRGSLRLDAAGRLTIRAGLFSGDTFTGGWNNTGPGTGAAQSKLFLKRLYLDAEPERGVEVQFGGLEFLRGESTEITSYDYDGYLVGERLALHRSDRVYFDEITVTYGYVGDLNQSSVFRRLPQVKLSNYHQFGLSKHAGKRMRVSADYTFESGSHTLRQAVTFHAPELRVADLLHFEQYERVGADVGYGFSMYGEKKLGRRISVGPGYAQLDRRGLYSDRFNVGKRVFWNSHIALGSEWSIMALATCAVAAPISSAPRARFDLILSYDILHRLRAARLV